MINPVLPEDRKRIQYFCCLIEYIARKTNNTREDIISYMPDKFIMHGLRVALTNACLSFEQVSDEYISWLRIHKGRKLYRDSFYKVFDHFNLGEIIKDCVIALIENKNCDYVSAIRYAMARPYEECL